jgi:hypothetical protein
LLHRLSRVLLTSWDGGLRLAIANAQRVQAGKFVFINMQKDVPGVALRRAGDAHSKVRWVIRVCLEARRIY